MFHVVFYRREASTKERTHRLFVLASHWFELRIQVTVRLLRKIQFIRSVLYKHEIESWFVECYSMLSKNDNKENKKVIKNCIQTIDYLCLSLHSILYQYKYHSLSVILTKNSNQWMAFAECTLHLSPFNFFFIRLYKINQIWRKSCSNTQKR